MVELTEEEKTTIYMYLVHEDFRLHNRLTVLLNNLAARTLTNDDLMQLILIRAKIDYFNEFKQNILYLLNLEN